MIKFAGPVIHLNKLFPKAEKTSKFIKVSQENIISQQEAIAKFMPEIEANGVDYEKFTQIKARPANPGEVIVTFPSDGEETKNTADSGDYIVSNIGGSGEEYIIKPDVLAQRYKEVGDGIYQAVGECRGVVYNGPEMSFIAPWSGAMVIKPGDMIVTPLPQKGQVYRIAKYEFNLTYRPKKEQS